MVSRTAHKDRTSYYSLNGRKTPFKEIASLLRDSGIDLDHNRFLILQVSPKCSGSSLMRTPLGEGGGGREGGREGERERD